MLAVDEAESSCRSSFFWCPVMRTFQPFMLLLVLPLFACSPTSLRADDRLELAAQLEFFEKQVRPLLVLHCYECHSAKAERLEASLRLDSLQGHLDGGDSGPSLVPGDPDRSLLIEAIRYESYEMPPKGKLSDKDINTLVRWVEMGAPWPKEPAPTATPSNDRFNLDQRRSEFWLWQPIARTTPPDVNDTDWPRNDIDHFVLGKLEAAALRPSVDADRHVLLRRLYFDLIGLPPTPEEVELFLNDDKAGGFGRAVDRLLASTHFGERWGRHWLDLVRYAESRGHEFDNDVPNAFQYRDYVIRALNADVPYDQFVREHIAGDLLPNPRLHPTEKFNESVIGTGFWFLGEWVHSPVDIRKDEADRFDNMLDVMSKTFLGVTVACARCHDHKFDAISTADYYSLSGFLQSSDYRQVRFEAIEKNRHVAEQLERIDEKYQRRILGYLKEQGVRQPSQVSYPIDESIVVDYATVPQSLFLQDGYVFGSSPQREGRAYLAESGTVRVATVGAAVSDPIWSGLESITVGHTQNQSSIAKLPKSGRTLRSPTFDVTSGDVRCLVQGEGHIVACVDSHRLVAGPLHKETVVRIQPGSRWTKLNLTRYVGHRLHLEFVPAANKQLAVRLIVQGLDDQALASLDQRLLRTEEKHKQYASQAEALLNSGREIETDEHVFADFESGTYDGWEVTGEAFGTSPQSLKTIAPYQGPINGVGRYFVNSHNIRSGGDVQQGDHQIGTLTSPEFDIDFDAIEFLVGGGNHQGRTCVNLVIDGEVVLTVTGKANNQMSLNTWDVRSFAGKTAKIQVVDNHRQGWGNIGIDHIVFRKLVSPEGDQVDRLFAASEASQIVSAWQREREQLALQIVRKSHLAPAMMDGSGEDDRILVRGNSSRPGDIEPRHFLSAISGDRPMQIRSGSGRRELAECINDPTNPLTARVIVNRVWHHLFGRGIVPTTDDFGVLGKRPTHPELLDHLASRFLDDGQSIKRLIRYIVLSRTYQMSGGRDADAVTADPKNLLWHHRPPKRLEGEAIRDSLLAISGRLEPKPLGPSVPIHLTPFMDGRGRPSVSGPLDGAGRRSIYVAVRRNFLSPFMLAFDTPVPFSTMGRRNASNVPAQALILMNDPFVAQQAEMWAGRAMESSDVPEDRIRWFYISAFARAPTPAELEVAIDFVTSDDSPDAWIGLAHALINTKEFIFIR